jgi:hypothetical protein
MTLIRNAVAGVVAGAVGTAAMDLVWYRRYRRDGGEDSLWGWESAKDVTTWDQASAPGQLGRKVLGAVTGKPAPDGWARLTTQLVHWATGVGWGVQYGVLAGRTSRHPWLRALALGPTAWSASYVVLPLAKVYRPVWTYDAPTLEKDLSAHLVYGVVASSTFALLTI